MGSSAGVRCKSSPLSRKYTMQQRELASLVLVSETGFPKGNVCKAPTAVHSLILTRRTTPAAGGYYNMRSKLDFIIFFKHGVLFLYFSL